MIDPEVVAWDKMEGLIPAVVQNAADGAVLMLGYMNRDALAASLDSGFVIFFSRSKGRLWMKGETSGNRLKLVDARVDCDGDALLILADPIGPTCHLGRDSCFGGDADRFDFLDQLERLVRERAVTETTGSYTARLLNEGLGRIAQKVGEEGVEVALAGVTETDDKLHGEVADLIYHLTVLLFARGSGWNKVIEELQQRRR